MIGAKHQRTKRGFTVAELLVVVTIFAIGSLSVSATYINFTRLHRRVANAEVLGEEMRFVMELLVRAARNNTVAYPAWPAQIGSPANQLSLKSSTGAPVLVKRFTSTDAACSGLVADCLAMSLDSGATWTAITGKNINVDRFDVYATPVLDPFVPIGIGTYPNNSQPRVTFVIDTTYKTSNPLEQAKLSVQTSVSSRIYVR